MIQCEQEDVFKVFSKEILMELTGGHQGGASCIQKSLMDISDQPLRLLKRSLKIHWEDSAVDPANTGRVFTKLQRSGSKLQGANRTLYFLLEQSFRSSHVTKKRL